MAQRATIKPWHEVVELRDDLKTGELSLSMFAADLHDVVMQKGRRPAYEDPAEFFALTYPTYNLRELVKRRLYASGRTIRQGVPVGIRKLRRRQDPHPHHAQASGSRPGKPARPTVHQGVRDPYRAQAAKSSDSCPVLSTR